MNFNKIVPSIFTDPQSLLQCDILESASMPWLIQAAAVCGSGSDNSEMMVTCQNLGEDLVWLFFELHFPALLLKSRSPSADFRSPQSRAHTQHDQS